MIFFLIIYSLLKLYLILDIYQQAHYYIKSYFIYFISHFIFNNICILLACLFAIYMNNIWLTLFSGFYIILYCVFYFQLRVKLVFSSRVKRLLCISIIYILMLSVIPFINYYLLMFIEFSIIPIFYLENFISKYFNNKYIKSAKLKLNNFSGIRVGITGSYGKTSTKDIIGDLLNIYYPTCKTIKSYNTELGISKFINDTPIQCYRYLILEYGASRKNDIKKLLNISNVDVAIVTEIGYMHMNGFKSIENVVEEKMSICKNASVVILNYDNEYIRNYYLENKCILSYGLEYGDYNAKNLNNGEFDFYYKNNFLMRLKTNLIGKHQILNLLAALSYIHYKGFDLNKIRYAVRLLKTSNNRLELKKFKNRLVLDDSFNSNSKGFIEALRVLGEYNFKKILITPGIVELFRYKRSIYNELIIHIVKNCDICILVGYKLCKNLYIELKKYNIEVYIVNSFLEGYSLYLHIIKNLKESVLLIENDLPDIYKRGLIF